MSMPKESAPIERTIKWEKTRSSAGKKKMSDRLEHNIMVTKVEAISNKDEETLPSVFEITKTQNSF